MSQWILQNGTDFRFFFVFGGAERERDVSAASHILLSEGLFPYPQAELMQIPLAAWFSLLSY